MDAARRDTREISLDIREIDSSGDGVAQHAGRRVLVPLAMPGERVRARVVDRRGEVWRAELAAVDKPSPHRIAPACPHFGPCGGCAWQHIAYPEQLRLKAALVDRLVRGAVPQAPPARPVLPGAALESPWGYRQKVHFVFGSTPGRRGMPLQMGHYARGSRRLVPVRECPVHDARGNAAAFALRDHLAAAGGGALRSVTVRAARHTSELMVTLVARDGRTRALREATRTFLRTAHGATSVHLNIHPRDDRFIFGDETRRLQGSSHLRDEVGDISYLMSPTSFFQTNVDAAERLVTLVLEAAAGATEVVDLYAGGGLFSVPLARAGHRVIAVESNRAAVADAEATLRLNRVPPERCLVVASPVEAAVGRLRAADAVVLDPPREGCSDRVLAAVFGRLRPARAVYVSCNPESLARDIEKAAMRGYAIESLQPLDMFPHTAHVETVAVLRRLRSS